MVRHSGENARSEFRLYNGERGEGAYVVVLQAVSRHDGGGRCQVYQALLSLS